MVAQQIPVDDLTIGMCVVGVDRPCLPDALLRLPQCIKNLEDIRVLKAHGVGYVTVDLPPLLRTVQHVARSLSTRPHDVPSSTMRHPKASHSLVQRLGAARTIRAEARTAMQSVFEGVRTGRPIHRATVQQTVQMLIDTLTRDHDVLLCVNHIWQFDDELFTHALNVCVFSLIIGERQEFSLSQLAHLGAGALLHDIGEVQLPYNLLHKGTVFTEQERRLMQQHPSLGHAILAHTDSMHEETLRIVLEHHERFDGSGYPAGRKGADSSAFSAIVGIADVYDAMLSTREGRPALLPERAMQELYSRGCQGEYDPYWVEQVMQCIGFYPVGSMVELTTGEFGVVIATNSTDVLRPTVEILWDASKRRYPTPVRVSLASSDPRGTRQTIVRAVHCPNAGVVCHGDSMSTAEEA